jgi:hypothetical protein
MNADKGTRHMINRISIWSLSFLMVVFSVLANTALGSPGTNNAVVTAIQGTAHVTTIGTGTERAIKKGTVIRKNQEVRVDERSRVEISFPDGTVMRLAEKSRLSMGEVNYDKKTENKNVKVGLTIGKLWAKVKRLVTPDSSVEVKTVNAVAGVRGTVYRVNVSEDKSAMVKVYDGSVSVSGTPKEGQENASGRASAPVPVPGPHEVPPPYHEVSMEEWVVIVKAMQQITISPQGVASPAQDFDPKADADDWVKWNQERDKMLAF